MRTQPSTTRDRTGPRLVAAAAVVLTLALGAVFAPPANAATSTLTLTLKATVAIAGTGGPIGVAYGSASNLVYTANLFTPTVSVVDATTNTFVKSISTGSGGAFSGFTSLAIDSASDQIFTVNQTDHTLVDIDGATDAITTAPLPAGVVPTAIAVDPTTGTLFVISSTTNILYVFDESTRAAAGTVTLAAGAQSTGIAVDPTNDTQYVTSVQGGSGIVQVIHGGVLGTPIAVGANPGGRWSIRRPTRFTSPTTTTTQFR